MQQASTFFSEEQRKRIESAVAEAEMKTSAEIVPAVATASGRYDRPEDIVGLWAGVVCMGVVWWFLPRGGPEAGSWGFSIAGAKLPILIIATVAGFVAGAAVATHIGWLRRLFTPRIQMLEEVHTRAHQAFFDSRCHHTEGGTGLLIYLSLFERMATVIADQTVLDKLGQSALDELCGGLTKGLRTGDPAEAVCAAIRQAGERLGEVLPPDAENPNELADSLVILD
jgi:putative membrane protein